MYDLKKNGFPLSKALNDFCVNHEVNRKCVDKKLFIRL